MPFRLCRLQIRPGVSETDNVRPLSATVMTALAAWQAIEGGLELPVRRIGRMREAAQRRSDCTSLQQIVAAIDGVADRRFGLWIARCPWRVTVSFWAILIS